MQWPVSLAPMSEEKSPEISYVLGTHDTEIERLGLQHRVWRPGILDLWQLAGITEGQTVIDAGAGPGHASRDLAEIAGPNGHVIALERSHRFVSAIRAHGAANIEAVETDLLDYDWPAAVADAVWCRWVLAFVADPAKALRGMARALKPGGALVIQEYFDYASWRLAPRSQAFEDYVAAIIAHWRTSGGDSDIGLALPRLLPELGLTIELVRPVVFATQPRDYVWRWPAEFARSHAHTLASAGVIASAQAIDGALAAYEADPNSLMFTPGVLQVITRKPG